LATKIWRGGNSGSTPGNAANWNDGTAPVAGDTLLMRNTLGNIYSSWMNIGGAGLTGNQIVLGSGDQLTNYNFNLSDTAVLSVTSAASSP